MPVQILFYCFNKNKSSRGRLQFYEKYEAEGLGADQTVHPDGNGTAEGEITRRDILLKKGKIYGIMYTASRKT